MNRTEAHLDELRPRHRDFIVGWSLLGAALVLNVSAGITGIFRIGPVDEIIHFCMYFGLSLVAMLFLYGPVVVGYPRHKVLLVLMTVCVGLALGLVWEWGEWGYDHLFGSRDVILGKFDTLTDLAVDALGAATAGVVLLSMLHRRQAEQAS